MSLFFSWQLNKKLPVSSISDRESLGKPPLSGSFFASKAAEPSGWDLGGAVKAPAEAWSSARSSRTS